MLCTSIRTESLSVVNTVQKGVCSHDGFTFKECSDYQTALVTVTVTIVTGCIKLLSSDLVSMVAYKTVYILAKKTTTTTTTTKNKQKKTATN